MSTAIDGRLILVPRSRAYAETRSAEADERQRPKVSNTAGGLVTFKNVSYWPANDASSRSSAQAEDRTATGPESSFNAASISFLRTFSSFVSHPATVTTNPGGTRSPHRIRCARAAAFCPETAGSVASPSGTTYRDIAVIIASSPLTVAFCFLARQRRDLCLLSARRPEWLPPRPRGGSLSARPCRTHQSDGTTYPNPQGLESGQQRHGHL